MMLKRITGTLFLMAFLLFHAELMPAEASNASTTLWVQQAVSSSASWNAFSRPAQPLEPERQLGLIIAIGLAGSLTWLRSQSKYSI